MGRYYGDYQKRRTIGMGKLFVIVAVVILISIVGTIVVLDPREANPVNPNVSGDWHVGVRDIARSRAVLPELSSIRIDLTLTNVGDANKLVPNNNRNYLLVDQTGREFQAHLVETSFESDLDDFGQLFGVPDDTLDELFNPRDTAPRQRQTVSVHIEVPREIPNRELKFRFDTGSIWWPFTPYAEFDLAN